MINRANWWEGAVIYQIYPRSFKDSNEDGIGDIAGIISKLRYIASLGVNAIWLCPVCASPMKDNGYDISDYRDINTEFGTLADMKNLFSEARALGIKIIIDLVFNHSSNKHKWFLEAACALKKNKLDNPYINYYYFKNSKTLPNNWRSYFGGPVWERLEGTDWWYLHLFAKEQPDLNWENPHLREELYDIINWWCEMGAAGFRIDAICNIKKDLTFAPLPVDGIDGLAVALPSCLAYTGIDDFLSEMRDRVFTPRGVFTVAEANGVPHSDLKNYIGANGYFSTIFEFTCNDIDIEQNCSYNKPRSFTTEELRDKIFAYQDAVQKAGGFGALYLENHDQNRCVNKYLKPEHANTYEGAALLAVLYFFLRGIPFIYQGQELAIPNHPWKNINELNDLSTHDQYKRMINEGLSEAQAFEFSSRRSRDNARTPMLWDGGSYAGFSGVKPWLPVHPLFKQLNVKAQEDNPRSILSFYKKMIAVRKKYSALFLHGGLTPQYLDIKNIISYTREYDGQKVLVFCNFSDMNIKIDISSYAPQAKIIIGNIRAEGEIIKGGINISPLESFAALL